MAKDINKLEIRKANENDVEQVMYFIKALAEHVNKLPKVEASLEDLQEHLFGNDNSAESALCFHEGKPVAFAVYFFMFSTFKGKPILYIEDIYVESEYRSKGIGRLLLKHLSTVALNKGCKSMQWACLNWNTKASKFYDSIGATRDEENILFELCEDKMKNL